MKRLFFAALLAFVMSAFLVAPSLASDACADMPGLHDPTVASLAAHVQHANHMGHIKNSLMPALTSQLNVAADESLPIEARVGALISFTNLVSAQAGKGIDAECAQHLIMQAQQVMVTLQA